MHVLKDIKLYEEAHRCFSSCICRTLAIFMAINTQLDLNLACTHQLDFLKESSKVIELGPLCLYCSLVFLWVRHGSPAHSRPDPVASLWAVGISPLVFAGKTQGGWGVGVFGCLLISSESRTGRQGNTHFQVFVKWFPHKCELAHTLDTHTCNAPSIRPRLSLPGCLHPAAQLEMTHTCARKHTHVYAHMLLRSLKSHSCFLSNHCSHNPLTYTCTEWKPNKRKCPSAAHRRDFFLRSISPLV